jgi:hypothetical protein
VTKKTVKPLPLTPRGLNFRQAAEYLGCSIVTFEKLVRLGLVPPAIDLPGVRRRIFDRLSLDAVITSRSKAPAAVSESERVAG